MTGSFRDDPRPRTTRTGRVTKAKKGLRVHECNICGKIYTRNEHLKRHRQRHGESASSATDSVATLPVNEVTSTPIAPEIRDINAHLATVILDASNGASPAASLDFDAFCFDLNNDWHGDAEHQDFSILEVGPKFQQITLTQQKFESELQQDWNYRQYVKPTENICASDVVTSRFHSRWRRLLETHDRSQETESRNVRSNNYRLKQSVSPDLSHSSLLETFWNEVHPYIQVFNDIEAFERTWRSNYPALCLIMLVLGAAQRPLSREWNSEHMARDAIRSALSSITFNPRQISNDTLRSLILADYYNTFSARRLDHRLSAAIADAFSSVSDGDSFIIHDSDIPDERHNRHRLIRLHNHISHIRDILLPTSRPMSSPSASSDISNEPLPTTHPDADTLESHLLDLAQHIPLRALLVIAGQSYLLGQKASRLAYDAAQSDILTWTKDPVKVSSALSAARGVLFHIHVVQPSSPWRDWGEYIACLTLWLGMGTRRDRLGIEEAKGQIGRCRFRVELEGREGWMKEEIVSGLEFVGRKRNEDIWSLLKAISTSG